MSDIALASILDRYGADRTRLIDILWDVQRHYGHIPEISLAPIGAALGISALDVLETASFYHFYLLQPAGKYQIYLCNSVLAKLNGYDEVRASLECATGASFGQIDPDATFNLFETPCIGLSDQEPAMLIAGLPFTRLRPGKVADIIAQLKAGSTPAQVANPDGLATDSLEYVSSLVETNVRTKRPVFFCDRIETTAALARMVQQTPLQVIDTLIESGLRGRGGAGFSTGLKLRLCRDALDNGAGKIVICNADEGEPGTFKDRVLLMRNPKQVFFGMLASAYAIGAATGIVYLRAEYVYLLDYLKAQLQQMRDQGLLGRAIGGQAGFDFDIRIQLGAGSYVCGDESALIESCEGKRGTPRIKPPFPVHSGYLGRPTSVVNVETLTCVSYIMAEGAESFRSFGTPDSGGTRLLSVAGDCTKPGIYEVEWGTSVQQILTMAGASDAHAVQVSGPSGECIAVAKAGQRRLGHEDLACNGAFSIFNRQRDLLAIAREHMQFFVEESCGICVPCRVGNVDLLHKLERIMAGQACQRDLDEMRQWGELVRKTSRCGLGGTAPKAILTVLENFPELFQAKLVESKGPLLPSFDRHEALSEYRSIALAVNQALEAQT